MTYKSKVIDLESFVYFTQILRNNLQILKI